jgi:type II secretory pathway pseudopilin PulG
MKFNRFHRQSGATMMEVLIAMTISLVVTSAMIAMMSNSLGTTTRIIHMTKLTDDMRAALQMMSRDVRRSSYNANSMYCYANDDCGTDGSSLTLAGDVVISDTADCFTFLTDRDHDGDSTEDGAGGFRHVTKNGVGVIEMWTGEGTPVCSDPAGSAGWVDITDGEQMDIFAFTVGDEGYTQEILNNGTATLNQKVRKIRMDMEGRLVLDNSITRHVEDVITIRNDLLL